MANDVCMHTKRCQSFLSLVFLMDKSSSSSPTFADLRTKYPSRHSIPLNSSDMAEPAQPLAINTLYNVYVVEELIQFTVESDAEFIANSHWTKDVTKEFSLKHLKAVVSVLNGVHASMP